MRPGDAWMNMDEYALEREASAPIDMLETYFNAHGLGLRAGRRGRDRLQLPGQLDPI